MFRQFAFFLLLPTCVSLLCDSAYAQHTLRASLEKMDRNNNKYIEPEEVTSMARPFFEQIATSGSSRTRLDLNRANSIERLISVVNQYNDVKNGAAGDVRIQPKLESENGLRPFGMRPDEPLVPEFGVGEIKFQYAQEDLDFADRTMKSHDENKDGYIDMKEAAKNKWTHRQPFADDLDHDNRLTRLEMAQRYARRRLLATAAGNLMKQAARTGEFREKPKEEKKRGEDENQWWRTGGSDYWLTASLMGRFDKNKNGKLEENEVTDIGIPTVFIDTDNDGEVTREELFAHVKSIQDEAGGSANGPPSWFHELDTNRDGQLTIPEFAVDLTTGKIREFEARDVNGDGLLTSAEVVGVTQNLGTGYSSEDGELLPPRKTVVSEIKVTDDFEITDLKIQITITHTYDSKLDAYLTGPDGQRIELFTAVGGSDDHFTETLFDDQAEESIIKGRPPFRGTFQPEALIKKQPGLSHYKGKSSQGIWQLIIRGSRSDRFGILHNWSLFMKGNEQEDS